MVKCMNYSVSSFKRVFARKAGIRSTAQRLRRFAANEDGNIAILFGFLVLTLFGFIGAAVDYARFNAVKSDITESMDAAGLAIAQLSASNETLTSDELEEYGRKFFHENFRYESLIENLDVDFTITAAKIIPNISGSMKTKMLRVGFFENFDMTSSSEITRKGSGQIELALVLDVTGSMGYEATGGGTRIENLRTAVDSLLQVMFGEETTNPNLKISVVPFNAYVNPGASSSWSSDWADTGAEAYYHGARFFHVGEDGEVDMNTSVNHLRLFDSVPNTTWKGCVEARPYPLDELDTPPGTGAESTAITSALDTPASLTSPSGNFEQRAQDAFVNAPSVSLSTSTLTDTNNSRWVPMFVMDGIDCNANWRGRCPSSTGNSYWDRTETFNIGGSSYSQYFWRSWFTDPSYDGYSESDYYNRSFLDDEDYIGRYGGENTGRYAKIVAEFRNLGINPGSLSASHQEWKTFMMDLGVRDGSGSSQEFYDTDIGDHHDGSEADAEEYILRSAYVGWWNSASQHYDYKYGLDPYIDESTSDNDSSTTGPNRACPEMILPLTNSRTDIEDHMDLLFPAGNTNSANGAIWGWRTLSADAPFTEGVEYSDGTWQKAVVIMTDGNNTTSDRDTHFGSDLTAYGYASESRMGDNMTDADDMEEQFDDKLLRICQRMKDQDILVYTIVFDLDNTATEEVFQACATTPNAPYYQKAPSGDDLETAFGDIAQDLVKLHISK